MTSHRDPVLLGRAAERRALDRLLEDARDHRTLGIRARVPLDVLRDTIQPFPTFSEAFVLALAELRATVPAGA